VQRTPKHRQSGFTLLEIALVLVLVGLLVGGVLRAQEMIIQARIKSVVNDFNGTTAAYFAYYDRYKAVPGDDPNAGGPDGRWTAAFNALAGGGDGMVSGSYLDNPAGVLGAADNTQGESMNFWWHLRLAGFVPGPRSGPGAAVAPVNAVGGLVGVQTGGMGLPGLVVCFNNVPDKIASAVDAMLDDHDPARGHLRARDPIAGSAVPSGTASNGSHAASSYVETGETQYAICKSI
jgi:prepilin-type N-terminal cleavage/methylation domain-containing protein